MPYKIDDLMAPGMNGPIRTTESTIQQPAVQSEPNPRQDKKEMPAKKVVTKPKKIKQKKEMSKMVQKAKDILIVLCMGLVGIGAIALLIRGIQFLFSI